MQGAVFQGVWFRCSESSWSKLELTAWQDTGGTSRPGAAIAEASGRSLGPRDAASPGPVRP